MELLKNLDFRLLGIVLICCFQLFTTKQANGQCDEVEQAQPTIMVVPWTKSNEDILLKIENDENYRSIISVIKDAFIQRDFKTEDFVMEYRNLIKNNTISVGELTQDDIIKQLIDNSTSDIIVKAEIRMKTGNLGNYVIVELSAEDTYTGENFANLPGPEAQSDQVRTSNYTKLAYKALNDKGGIERFLNDMNKGFSSIREKGRTLSVRIEVSENAEIDLEEEMDDDFNYLSDLILDWVKENAYKNNYHVQGNSSNLLYLDAIKIPLRDDECQNYDTSTFAKEMRKGITRILRQNSEINPHKISQNILGNSIYFVLEKK